MIEGKILVARREDLKEKDKEKPLEDISISDFKGGGELYFNLGVMKDIMQADFVLFVDDDGRERIFKSRYGKDYVIF
jgi:hypothetical protein